MLQTRAVATKKRQVQIAALVQKRKAAAQERLLNCFSLRQQECFRYFLRIIENYFYSGSYCSVVINCDDSQLSFLLENILVKFGKPSIEADYSQKSFVVYYSNLKKSQLNKLRFIINIFSTEKKNASLSASLSEGDLVCDLSAKSILTCIAINGQRHVLPFAEGCLCCNDSYTRTRKKLLSYEFSIRRMSECRARKCFHEIRKKVGLK